MNSQLDGTVVVGVDGSPRMVEVARAQAARLLEAA